MACHFTAALQADIWSHYTLKSSEYVHKTRAVLKGSPLKGGSAFLLKRGWDPSYLSSLLHIANKSYGFFSCSSLVETLSSPTKLPEKYLQTFSC